MHDILPRETPLWQGVEHTLRSVLASYGYQEIRLPLVEATDLFRRSIGEVTDIVEKEMYTFADRNGDSLTLRPEGTAGCARAVIEAGLLRGETPRLWYQGPMFRHERPQKGRYRQFHQLGVEVYGLAGPDIDAELLLLSARAFRQLGLNALHLEINTLGERAERAAYRVDLVDYLQRHRAALDPDSERRLNTNPLRVLDSKVPETQAIVADAPVLCDYLGAESRAHFAGLCSLLETAGVSFRVNARLVRGLDYYTKTVFEWVSGALGAQGTVCAGGRYDGLVAQLGGPDTAAIGFAAGLERLVLLAEAVSGRSDPALHVYCVAVGEVPHAAAMGLAEHLRDRCPALRLQVHCGGGNFGNQLKRADKSGALYAFIVGEEEAARREISLKPLRRSAPQRRYAWDALISGLAGLTPEAITSYLNALAH